MKTVFLLLSCLLMTASLNGCGEDDATTSTSISGDVSTTVPRTLTVNQLTPESSNLEKPPETTSRLPSSLQPPI